MHKDIKDLIRGYHQFREHHIDKEDTTFKELVRQGQNPKALVIACSDSRVDPALVMECQPGDLFVIRNVANLVPPYEEDQAYHGTSAALEYGVCTLNIQHVILFGHTQCGGIQMLVEDTHKQARPNSFLTIWMELAKASQKVIQEDHTDVSPEEKVTLCGQYSLINSLKNLRTFPWIARRVAQGSLNLYAWNFDMSKGILQEYDESLNSFRVITNPDI